MSKALTVTAATAILAVALLWLRSPENGNAPAPNNIHSYTDYSDPATAKPAPQPTDGNRDRLEVLYLEQGRQIKTLNRQIAELAAKIERLQAQPARQTHSIAAPSHSERPTPSLAIAQRFENNNASQASVATRDVNIQDLIYANLPNNADAPMTDCNGSMCKIYTFSDDRDVTNGDFVSNLSKNLSSNVNVYFVDEQGQQVIYVEAVE